MAEILGALALAIAGLAIIRADTQPSMHLPVAADFDSTATR